MFPLSRFVARSKVVLISVAGVVVLTQAFPRQAQAIDVIVNHTTYDVIVFSGSYNDNKSKFNASPNGAMPWFGNEGLAANFATALGTSLGTSLDSIGVNSITYPVIGRINYGDLFATRIVSILSGPATVFGVALTSNNLIAPVLFYTSGMTPRYWAQAVAKVPASAVPAPLPLLGMALTYGYSRKLRSRIRSRQAT